VVQRSRKAFHGGLGGCEKQSSFDENKDGSDVPKSRASKIIYYYQRRTCGGRNDVGFFRIEFHLCGFGSKPAVSKNNFVFSPRKFIRFAQENTLFFAPD
jgi:hypothetical protein